MPINTGQAYRLIGIMHWLEDHSALCGYVQPTGDNMENNKTLVGEAGKSLIVLEPQEIDVIRNFMGDVQSATSGYYAESRRGGDLGVWVRRFLSATQALNEILQFQIKDKETYGNLLATGSHPSSGVIDAVKFARNVSQHILYIVRPSDDVTLVGGVHGMRTYAVWDTIPSEIVLQLRAGTQTLESAYQSHLEGQEVTGTMLAVLRFFADVNSSIIHRDSNGEWSGFPLQDQPGVAFPLHPEEPLSPAGYEAWLNDRLPNGDCRLVLGQVTVEGNAYLFGHTFIGNVSFAPFVESLQQARDDISRGFEYFMGDVASHLSNLPACRHLQEVEGALFLDGDPREWGVRMLHVDLRADWAAPGVDVEGWRRVVTLESNTSLPPVSRYLLRRARRLNATVPVEWRSF